MLLLHTSPILGWTDLLANDIQVYGMDSTFKAVHPCEEVYGELSSTSRPQAEAAVEEIGPPKWAKWVETCGDGLFLNMR